ncbi:beta-N-acetylhexosaminidase [Roseisalinus antarcticus]|uniref:beta-N-acetylhexosaminidase n=1 Tax=Roseisalinus antarcticus TaxID=254357 RepID=A0A1Y5SZ32_9RHOB|nr:beta-N-acetylhexosaminidase [Roseisalinus antarcticus]SLN50194.1 Beta-hexosaminidase [Roseisalinus antarcticus]
MKLAARIDGAEVVVEVTSDRPLAAPVFCFSMMAPVRVVSGGRRIAQCGGYTEVRLADLAPGVPVTLRLAHEAGIQPANRAWLPLGAYLRAGGETIPLPPLPAGCRPRPLAAGPAPDLRLVPPVADWQPSGGQVSVSGFLPERGDFSAVEALAARTGLGPFLSDDGLPLSCVRDVGLPDEGYRLEIRPDGVTLTAGDRAGEIHGAITLLTLKATHECALPCGVIADSPRFAWRGQHLDCARHFYDPATIRRLMDLMALLKLNRFHWHFADDEAFRLEIDGLAELWQQSTDRGEGALIPGVFGGGIRAGGSYSAEDVAGIVAHGQALGISVLPEIEVPAHALALRRVFPDLGDPADTGTEVSVQGYAENVVNPALPRTWEVIETMADGVCRHFPMPMLHLGCDELPEGAWDGSPAVAALKRREGLASRDDVQGWTMARLAARLDARGIRPAAWEEAARGGNGGIGHGALLFSWSGQAPGIAAARAGYDVVMCPAQNVYFDMAHSDDPQDWGAAWAAFVSLEDTLAWDPVPDGADDIAERVVGVQGCFWSEFTTRDDQMEAMIAPRILGLATKAWDRADAMTGAELRGLAKAYVPVFAAMAWQSALT